MLVSIYAKNIPIGKHDCSKYPIPRREFAKTKHLSLATPGGSVAGSWIIATIFPTVFYLP